MDEKIRQMIEVLRSREVGMRECIAKSASRGEHDARIHYFGWLRGIEESRRLVEVLFRESKDDDERERDDVPVPPEER